MAVRRQSTTPSESKADKAQTQNNPLFVDLLETINCIQMTVSCRYKPDVGIPFAQFNLSPVWLIQARQQSSGRKRGWVLLIILLCEPWPRRAEDDLFKSLCVLCVAEGSKLRKVQNCASNSECFRRSKKAKNKKQCADEVLYNPPNQVMSHEAI